MNVAQVTTVSISSFLCLSLMTFSVEQAFAQQGDESGVQLKAKMVSGSASGKASYHERDNGRYLNLEVGNLPNTSQSLKAVFVDGVWVGNVTFIACPAPVQQLLCGKMELSTQEGQAVPVVTGGQTIQIGLNPALIAGTF
jgi:hypothetical protein